MDKKSGPKKKDALRLYQEQLAEAARALDSLFPGRAASYALGLLRDATHAEEAGRAQIAGVRNIEGMSHLASDFIEAAPAGVNPFLASFVLASLVWARQDGATNWDGWKGKLKRVLSEWVPSQPARSPSSLSGVFAVGIEHGPWTVESIAKARGCPPQTIRSAASEGRKRLGLPRLRKRRPT